MVKKIFRLIIRVIQKRILKVPNGRSSYSQSGEDAIVQFIFNELQIIHPTYLDVGAHHPYNINNTASLYLSGSCGVNIEPNPELYKLFLKERKRDININLGVSSKIEELDYYSMSDPGLNTFSKNDALYFVEKHGHKILDVSRKKTTTIDSIIENHCFGKFPDFLSLDVEGLDLSLIKSIDYDKSSPIVICVETSTHSITGHTQKIEPIINFLLSKNYILYADTNINSIFVQKEQWLR